jgi:hypothetical protein
VLYITSRSHDNKLYFSVRVCLNNVRDILLESTELLVLVIYLCRMLVPVIQEGYTSINIHTGHGFVRYSLRTRASI